jgi:hypothetical protein
MSDDEAKRVLRAVLASYPGGSVLHLLSEMIEEDAQVARRDGDDGRAEQLAHAACTLFVLGLGLHALLPTDDTHFAQH